MPPNVIDPTLTASPEDVQVEQFKITVPPSGGSAPSDAAVESNKENKGIAVCLSALSLFARILIGAVVGISYAFAFRNGSALNATNLHIVLCVTGFQLLMAEAILCLAEEGGWTRKLNLVEKRRVHWILQLIGSILAIAGCFIKIVDKNVHWTSLHGQFALVALVFTSVCLVNGLTSLYAYELRRYLPGNISKITHICFGIVAFASATISLCYGFDKNFFRTWLQFEPLTETVICLTAMFAFIVMIVPTLTFYRKSRALLKV